MAYCDSTSHIGDICVSVTFCLLSIAFLGQHSVHFRLERTMMKPAVSTSLGEDPLAFFIASYLELCIVIIVLQGVMCAVK